jgi:hypothetical protein
MSRLCAMLRQLHAVGFCVSFNAVLLPVFVCCVYILYLHRLSGFSATSGMIGIRSALLTATKGTVVLDTQFDSYKPCVGIVAQREKGSLLAHEQGNRVAAVHTCLVWC